MYFDLKGPLIFSASLHFALIVFFIILSMLQPEKEPEELIFELYSPVVAAPAEVRPQIEYTPPEMNLPSLDEIPDPEIPELPPEPKPRPEETIPVESDPEPVREVVNFEEFQKTNPIARQRVPERKPQTRRNNDLSREVDRLKENLNQLPNQITLPQTAIDSFSATDQNRLNSYFSQLVQAVLNSIEIHPLEANPLQTKVQFSLGPTGIISGVHVLASSGDSIYDQKVVEGFNRLARFKPPPGFNKTESLILTIKQRDR